ncbi:MAG: hypothetical protein KJO91_10880 [Gammaproteobacteria bacterium]|nr:hypothetical protein [Gammaproteobacteria bacterium]
MSAKVKVLKNLEGRLHGVNFGTATSGIKNGEDASAALTEAINEGLVVVEETPVPGQKFSLPMYKLSWAGRKVKTNLRVVK